MKNLFILLIFTLLLTSCTASGGSNGLYFGSPDVLMCLEEDLPGEYLLLDDLSGARPNNELVIDIDQPEATDQYIELTGRLSGWEHRFMLIEMTETLPGFILCQVVVFESTEGAQNALQWPHAEARRVIETDRQIGDEIILTEMAFDAPDGNPWIDYRVEFTHQNLLGATSTYAPANIASPEFALDLAEVIYQRMLEIAP